MSRLLISKERRALIGEAADKWRRENREQGGAVIVEIDDRGMVLPVGWCMVQKVAIYMDFPLTLAASWVPGTYALSVNGDLWKATGGDFYSGAKRWEPVGVSL